MDTIKYHTLPETQYGKVTKRKQTLHARAKRPALSHQNNDHKAAMNIQEV